MSPILSHPIGSAELSFILVQATCHSEDAHEAKHALWFHHILEAVEGIHIRCDLHRHATGANVHVWLEIARLASF